MLWMNGTEIFAAIYEVEVSSYSSYLALSVWNISQIDPIKTFNIT